MNTIESVSVFAPDTSIPASGQVAAASGDALVIRKEEQMKTRAEVDDLKAQWKADPCWDIEDTEGFEEYRAELFDWRIAYNDEIRHQKHLRILNFAQRYDVPIGIADYILTLEARIARLEGKE